VVREAVAVTRGSSTRVIVNDRLDVAIACGADGVHLRGDSIAVAAVRRVAPRGFIVGRSVHAVEEALAAAGADYLIAGTVFPSASKPRAALLGCDGLAAIARSVDVPVLAIGGITESRVDAVVQAGAAGCAAIGLFIRDDHQLDGGDSCRAVPLVSLVERLRKSFD